MTKEKANQDKGFQRLLGAFLYVLAVCVLFGIFFFGGEEESVETAVEAEKGKPNRVIETPEEEIEKDETKEETPLYETEKLTFGIDVSQFQEEIDWKTVSEAGIDFVMVRIGYRKTATGELLEDARARYNLQGASEYGIHLGAYFFSTAVDEQEVREEADWVCSFLKDYPITYPVVYNCEGFQRTSSRQYGMTIEERTALAQIFLDQVEEAGYTGMFYAAKGELENSLCWDTEALEARYRIWVAQYLDPIHPTMAEPEYDGEYAMWQYSDHGSVPGVPTIVDLNVAYFGYEK